MFYSKEEIELTLKLYSIAKIHLNQLERDKIRYSDINTTYLNDDYFYYSHIVCLVDSWLNFLLQDEVDIINLRIFNKKSYDYIASQLGYANHSSIVRKFKGIIRKICNRGYKNE